MDFESCVTTLIVKGRGHGETEAALMQYMEVTAPADVLKSLGLNCVRWSASDVMDDSVCGKESKHCILKVGDDMNLRAYRL